MTTHPIYAAINKPLLLLGIDRRACSAAIVAVLLPRIVAALFKQVGWFHSLLGLRGLFLGAALGGAIWAVARISAAHDPQFVSLMLAAVKLRQRYDAGRTQ
jgi:type IV secretory pathway VirB3-like protein